MRIVHVTMKVLAVLSCLFALPALLTAQPRTNGTNKPSTVTVTKTDGSIVRGILVSIDPAKLVVQPVATKKDEKIEPVTLTWKEISKLSSGMTQKILLDKLRKDHPDQLCITCGGRLTVPCEICKGTGHSPESGKECKTCGGELLVPCKAAGCKDGKATCPRPCLKLTQGSWYIKENSKEKGVVKEVEGVGLKWRRFPVRGGTYQEWSEKHLGEIVVTGSDGIPRNEGKCPLCGGATQIDCPNCHGLAKVPCPECSNRKDAPECPEKCDHGQKPCPTCDGTGMKK